VKPWNAVIDGHEGQAPTGRERLGAGHPDEQCPHQAGPLGHRDEFDVVEGRPGAGQRVGDDRVDQLEMPARGDLGDHPAVAVVNAL